MKTIANASNQVTANGSFTAVSIKTRFDETTISSTRGNALLYPNSRVLTMVDDQGRKYSPSSQAQKALELAGGAGTPRPTALRPGEAFTTKVAFVFPSGPRKPTPLINEGEEGTTFVNR